MDPEIRELLQELATYGAQYDREAPDRLAKLRNITPDTGQFLAILVRTSKARRILEIGTSNGYSTIWLADAARSIGGRVTTVETEAGRIDQARTNLIRAGLLDHVDTLHEDAYLTLERSPVNAWDLIFLDAERPYYRSYWSHILRSLRLGGVLIVDNAISHADQIAKFKRLIDHSTDFESVLTPIGNGQIVAERVATEEGVMEAEDVIAILDRFDEANIDVWVDGGWGVDALVGRQTRPHEDLDLVIGRADLEHSIKLFEEIGFYVVLDERPASIVIRRRDGLSIDMHPVDWDDEGNAIQLALDGEPHTYPAPDLKATGTIGGRQVHCLSPELSLKGKTGYPFDSNDLHDRQLLRDEFGLELTDTSED